MYIERTRNSSLPRSQNTSKLLKKKLGYRLVFQNTLRRFDQAVVINAFSFFGTPFMDIVTTVHRYSGTF